MSQRLKKINTLTVWKSKKSLGTCVTLVSIKARLARTFSNVITVVTYWSVCITIARYKRQKINIHIISYGRMKGFFVRSIEKRPTSLTVWKSKKSFNTFITLVTKNLCWLADAMSISIITASTLRSLWITVASYKLSCKLFLCVSFMYLDINIDS